MTTSTTSKTTTAFYAQAALSFGIALTGFGMEADMKDCLDAGFNVHITKPMNLQRLNKVIQEIAAGKKVQE